MATIPQLLYGLLLAVLLFFLFRWLIIDTEGVFLGRRVVVWLYDLTAGRYDRIKEFDHEDEAYLVGRPILSVVRAAGRPLVLDVATGTGRVPYNLVREEGFDGLVVGIEPSRRMLSVARTKLEAHADRVALCRGLAGTLPFADGAFDAVTCLEALEFFPSDEVAAREMTRVLRPGGVLVTTRRKGREGRAFLRRYRDEAAFEAMLVGVGLDRVWSQRWEANYDLVMAWKPEA